MDTNVKEGSARIYQFPRGGRASLAPRLGETRQIAPSLQPTICSGSWYHDEAIQEAKPAWDR
ncbi:DUF2735 domain-containing protein [Bradyrhizobium sp. STM 3809]|uniref:DUF2735 domain-containing protein n=1 Tax=Bradyrhizobium sp. STM 3809 TaxID=551936 RepID=UPI000240A7BE|nr:DUF2735 domain-containing protein [Bradyrhizobium sp. STM 3809]CCD98655.1 putative glutamine synthetase translation inhibitor GstI-like [Bradyrhizobium sp. STM 3809]